MSSFRLNSALNQRRRSDYIPGSAGRKVHEFSVADQDVNVSDYTYAPAHNVKNPCPPSDCTSSSIARRSWSSIGVSSLLPSPLSQRHAAVLRSIGHVQSLPPPCTFDSRCCAVSTLRDSAARTTLRNSVWCVCSTESS